MGAQRSAERAATLCALTRFIRPSIDSRPSARPVVVIFFKRSGAALDLHSFPTRRSSDLQGSARVEVEGQDRDLRSSRDRLQLDRKSTRLNSSHITRSYAVFCLKKQKVDLAMLAHPWYAPLDFVAASPEYLVPRRFRAGRR